MTLNTLKNVNYDRILQIWKERFANPGQFVYYFVGNFDESSLRPLIEKYIASLPKGKAEIWKEVPSYVNGNVVNKFTRKSETPKAIASSSGMRQWLTLLRTKFLPVLQPKYSQWST